MENIERVTKENFLVLYQGSLERWQEQDRRDRSIENLRGQQQKMLEDLSSEAYRQRNMGENQEELLKNIKGRAQNLEKKTEAKSGRDSANLDPRIEEWIKRQPIKKRKNPQEIEREENQNNAIRKFFLRSWVNGIRKVLRLRSRPNRQGYQSMIHRRIF